MSPALVVITLSCAKLVFEISRSPKARLICWVMRGQPYRGLRRFIVTMASMISLDGPFGPGFLPPLGEYSSRYFRFFRALWNDSRVDAVEYRQIDKTDHKPVNGSFLIRRPVAAKIAFVTAGIIDIDPISPTPLGSFSLSTKCICISGDSSILNTS